MRSHPDRPTLRTRRDRERLAIEIVSRTHVIGRGELVLDSDADAGPEWAGEVQIAETRWWASLARGTDTLRLSHPRRPFAGPDGGDR
ncbi:MAG TPA: hypothetical protein VME47_14800 [Acetobacteraceae bacterium]|nr:hypothetical protein [Acetobacteraceae bacterium]